MTESRILGRCPEENRESGHDEAIMSARDGRVAPLIFENLRAIALPAARRGTAWGHAAVDQARGRGQGRSGRPSPGRGRGAPPRGVQSLAQSLVQSLRSLLLLVPILAVSSTAMAEEPGEPAAQPGDAYILHLGPVQPQSFGSGAGLDSLSSPTGVPLPDAYAYFDLGDSQAESTYFTPRIQGLQVTWTSDQGQESLETSRGNAVGSRTYLARPKSIGANFARSGKGFEFSLGGDYGRTPKSVPNAMRLVDDKKLLRVGAHARIREFTLGGAIGSDADPSDLGETLSWDAFGRYDFGALAVGFVYNYTLESDSSAVEGGGMVGTLQIGANYFFTPRMALNMNLAYGNYIDEDAHDDSGIAGVLGFSLDF